MLAQELMLNFDVSESLWREENFRCVRNTDGLTFTSIFILFFIQAILEEKELKLNILNIQVNFLNYSDLNSYLLYFWLHT